MVRQAHHDPEFIEGSYFNLILSLRQAQGKQKLAFQPAVA